MDPDVLELAQVLGVLGAFAAFASALFIAVRVALARTGPKPLQRNVDFSVIDEARFARLEQAVDAIAVEVERISEAQRFTAKLLGERGVESGSD